jgi:Fe-S cluster assembly protein SufD
MSSVSAFNQPPAVDHYRTLFAERTAKAGGDALTALRQASLDRFLVSGFPTQRDEAWKYTSLRRLETRRFALAEAPPVATDDERWIPDCGHRIVLVNGRMLPALSTPAPQPPGLTILSLAQWMQHSPAEVAEFLSRNAFDAAGPFENLNGAFSDDGIVIDIAAGTTLDRPLYIVHHWRASKPSTSQMAHPRIIVRAGRQSHCSIVTHYTGDDAGESLTNAWVSFDVAAGAHVEHLRLQEEGSRTFHIDSSQVRLARDARFTSHDFALGASLGRSSTLVHLAESGASVNLNGLFAPTATQHLDTYIRIDHAAAHTQSQQDYRGIAAGRGRGVFNGKVIVRPHAQKIDAKQSNRNLLLSATAEIDSRPELEIYADDVKCSHGATTGQLDRVSLFYLRSRGLGEDQARALLIRAFAQSMLSTVKVGPVRTWLEERVQRRFDLSASGIPEHTPRII